MLVAVVLKHRHVVLKYLLPSCATMMNLEINNGTAHPPVVLNVLQTCRGESFAIQSCPMVRCLTTFMSSHLQGEYIFRHQAILVHSLTDGLSLCACSDLLRVNMERRKHSTEQRLVKRSK